MNTSENFRYEEVSNRRCRYENKFKVDIKEVGYGCMEWIDLAQDRDRRVETLVNVVMNFRVP
jgi:hypothetical protein